MTEENIKDWLSELFSKDRKSYDLLLTINEELNKIPNLIGRLLYLCSLDLSNIFKITVSLQSKNHFVNEKKRIAAYVSKNFKRNYDNYEKDKEDFRKKYRTSRTPVTKEEKKIIEGMTEKEKKVLEEGMKNTLNLIKNISSEDLRKCTVYFKTVADYYEERSKHVHY